MKFIFKSHGMCFRIEFDATVRNQLNKTLPHLLKSIHEVEQFRLEELEQHPGEMSWVLEPDLSESLAYLALRKTDLQNFMLNNEGNLYNNLFYKVMMSMEFLWIYLSISVLLVILILMFKLSPNLVCRCTLFSCFCEVKLS